MGHARNILFGSMLALGMLGSASGTATAATGAEADDGRWHFTLTPYLWLPNVNGSADVTARGLRGADGQDLGQVGLSSEIGPNDYLSNLQMALMLIGEARKGPWSVFTDVMYVDFGNEKTHLKRVTGPLGVLSTEISREAKTDLSSTVWTLAAGYTIVRDPSWNLDLFAGFRYLTMSSDLNVSVQDENGRYLRDNKISMDQDVWDGIVGARGEVRFSDSRWFMPYYVDVGTGSSNWTWQAILGAGYRFDWGDVTLALRSLSYDFDKNNADVRFTGPALGVSFRW